MRPEARLDSAVFQLTPTRTRCDLVIIANGKTEKIASGLLNPFLAHLKTAQEQIAKGGYSIRLEPDHERGSAWFTKGTVERFVRFVSTPEVLERVTTIESEISQIENAIAIQSNSSTGLSAAEESQINPSATNEGTKASAESEKAIVLYKPGSQPQLPDTNGSTTEENSKVKLLKVLETRKTVLQKEQGMAFARAVAAGFDMDSLVDLISFAEAFSASRLMVACIKFMDLWKKKHETGQWLEVEAAEISSRSEFSCLNTSGIILTADMMAQNEHVEAWHASNGDAGPEANGNAEKQNPSDPRMPGGPQGQYQHPMYSQWPMHTPPGPPGFQPYPVQGMPHYMNYPGGMPYFPPPYPPREDRRYSASHKTRSKKHSMDNANVDSETWERSTRSQDDSDENLSDYDKESSRGSESHRKADRSGKKKSGVVVIRNLNYITSRKHGGSGSESDSATSSEPEEGSVDLQPKSEKRRHKNSKKSSVKEGIHKKHTEDSDTYSKDDAAFGLDADSGNWQAFQNFLLTAEDKARAAAEDMFSGEKATSGKKKKNKVEADLILPGRDFHDDNGQRMVGLDSVDGQATRLKQIASNDDLVISSGGRGLTDIRLKEIEGGGGGYRRMSTDEFLIYGQDKHLSNNKSFSDPLVNQTYQLASKVDKGSSNNITDESFLLPHRSGFQDNLAPDNRRAIDIDSELTLVTQTTQDSSKTNVQINYEPHDLSLVPERETENMYANYDPALDYDFQLPVENAKKLEDDHQEENASTSTKEEPKKVDKKSLRASHDSLEKRKKDAMMKKIASSRLNPPADAQKRAEKLRAFKADMQKLKKEQEEENIRRLEALKLERQKRIAARSGSNSAAKVSPSHKGSKFSDSETGSSPLQKLPTKASRLNGSAHEVTRSASSLSISRKENNGFHPEAKGAHIGTKRLSVP